MKAPRVVVAFVVAGACGASVGNAQTAGTGDVAKGAASFRTHCAACHSADASGGSGPDLRGVVGRTAASVPDFAYSAAMRRAGKTWTVAELQAFLAHPQSAVPGTRMAFAGIHNENDRVAAIAYLRSISPNNVPLPAPLPEAAPAPAAGATTTATTTAAPAGGAAAPAAHPTH